MPVENRNTFPCVQGLTLRTKQKISTPAKQNQMFRIVMPQKQNPAVRKNASTDTPSGLLPGSEYSAAQTAQMMAAFRNVPAKPPHAASK